MEGIMEEAFMREISGISREHGVDICWNTQPCGGYTISVARGDQKEQAWISSWYMDQTEFINKIYELIEELDRKTITI